MSLCAQDRWNGDKVVVAVMTTSVLIERMVPCSIWFIETMSVTRLEIFKDQIFSKNSFFLQLVGLSI